MKKNPCRYKRILFAGVLVTFLGIVMTTTLRESMALPGIILVVAGGLLVANGLIQRSGNSGARGNRDPDY